ncbi:MAG TPA: hypothetical protein VKN16_22110, partial [Methylomirabilota bacterium]|nr:hypothetical protein [Methylomirabilota bacterium]
MRVVFWNIRHGGGVRTAAIARQIRAWSADAVALCEFRGTPPSAELARALAPRADPGPRPARRRGHARAQPGERPEVSLPRRGAGDRAPHLA